MGSQGEDDGQFLHPHSIALDSEGNEYVTDMANYNVQKFDSKGNFLLKWGEEGTSDGQFKAPEGLAIDSSDKVYAIGLKSIGARTSFVSPAGEPAL